MGKKSRKTGKKKKEHKDRVQQRQQQRYETADNNHADDDDAEDGLPPERQAILESFYVGDRVWLNEGREYRRCVLVSDADDDGMAVVVDVELDPSSHNQQRVAVDCLRHDPWPWVLEFDIGDRVVIFLNESPRWTPATVVRTLVINAHADFAYRCELDDGSGLVLVHDEWAPVPHLDSFRFAPGDKVLFYYAKALGIKNHRPTLGSDWVQGEVVRVDILHRSDFYAVYEVRYPDRGRQLTCYIQADTDDCIAALDATPRQRFLDAVEQGCPMAHLDYLVQSSGLSVEGFMELVFHKAVEHASYDGLLWLQERAAVNLFEIEDQASKPLFLRLCQSPKAYRFFRRATEPSLR